MANTYIEWMLGKCEYWMAVTEYYRNSIGAKIPINSRPWQSTETFAAASQRRWDRQIVIPFKGRPILGCLLPSKLHLIDCVKCTSSRQAMPNYVHPLKPNKKKNTLLNDNCLANLMRIESVNKMCAHLTLHYNPIIAKAVVVHIPPLLAMRLMNFIPFPHSTGSLAPLSYRLPQLYNKEALLKKIVFNLIPSEVQWTTSTTSSSVYTIQLAHSMDSCYSQFYFH